MNRIISGIGISLFLLGGCGLDSNIILASGIIGLGFLLMVIGINGTRKEI